MMLKNGKSLIQTHASIWIRREGSASAERSNEICIEILFMCVALYQCSREILCAVECNEMKRHEPRELYNFASLYDRNMNQVLGSGIRSHDTIG